MSQLLVNYTALQREKNLNFLKHEYIKKNLVYHSLKGGHPWEGRRIEMPQMFPSSYYHDLKNTTEGTLN